ncbi:hypothetical protein IWW55_003801, partial [Coemansia sp. RSA 2706]
NPEPGRDPGIWHVPKDQIRFRCVIKILSVSIAANVQLRRSQIQSGSLVCESEPGSRYPHSGIASAHGLAGGPTRTICQTPTATVPSAHAALTNPPHPHTV